MQAGLTTLGRTGASLPRFGFKGGLTLVPVVLVFLALAAHFFRAGDTGLTLLWAALPLLIAVPRRWAARSLQVLLGVGAVIWVRTGVLMLQARLAQGLPWGRMVAIMAVVAALTAGAATLFQSGRARARFRTTGVPTAPSVVTFLLVLGLFAIIQLKVPRTLLLAERFAVGTGWLQAVALATYAAFVAEKMLDPRTQSKTRRLTWGLFSFFFFLQLILGLAGADRLLMTGDLHLPVPALVLAGPLYRGGGLFMAILFGVTVLLVGPAWCSHLCYIGAWDSAMAGRARRPAKMPRWRNPVRIGITVLVFATAFGLGRLGAPTSVAVGLAAFFGLAGVGVMVFWSRKTGVMTHCTTWCPTGVLATWLGKISPFRMRIKSGCTDCMACSLGCRYDALRPEDIARRRPGSSCTLCGDCVGRCRWTHVEYTFPGLSPTAARATFITLVATLHAVFLGVAML